jgi:hypothetical protein
VIIETVSQDMKKARRLERDDIWLSALICPRMLFIAGAGPLPIVVVHYGLLGDEASLECLPSPSFPREI